MDTNQSLLRLEVTLVVMALVWLAVMASIVVAWAHILRKAGYSAWWVFIGFVPVANIVMFFVFAYTRWPVEDAAAHPAFPQAPAPHLPPNRRR